MTSNIPDVSERLANTLATWQVLNFTHEIETLVPFADGLLSWKEVLASERHTKLADTILDGSIEHFDNEVWQPDERIEYLLPEKLRPSSAEKLRNYYSFPYELFRWNRASRRVFHIPHALEVVLAAAELPDIRWSDVLWPFDSFIISLEKPLVMAHPVDGIDQRLDAVMVTRITEADGTFRVLFRWFHVPGKPGKRYGLTRKEVAEFRKLKKDKPEFAAKMIVRKTRELGRDNQHQIGSFNASIRISDLDKVIPVESEVLRVAHGGVPDAQGNAYDRESTNSYFDGLSVTLRIVVGWMLYLETLSPKSVAWRVPKSTGPRMIVGGASAVIIEPDRVCDIVGKGLIQPAEVSNESHHRCSKGFVRPHWRRAHYKRPRGSAPGDPKTVRIPPVLVRADLVPLYGIVGGTTSIAIVRD